MTDELHFEVQVEEGERHPADGRELRLIVETLMRIEQVLRKHTHLLERILEREPKPHYPATSSGSIAVE